jgi:hypothetical protein
MNWCMAALRKKNGRAPVLIPVAEEEVHGSVPGRGSSFIMVQKKLGHDRLAHSGLAAHPQGTGRAIKCVPGDEVACGSESIHMS